VTWSRHPPDAAGRVVADRSTADQYPGIVHCPACRALDTRVVDSRTAEEGAAVRRRRQCPSCGHRFTTFERVDHVPLTVLKSDGSRQPFDREKLIAGLRAATKGRAVDEARLEMLATAVEDATRLHGSEVASAVIGLAVLDELRAVDDVAYLRFASVYKDFDAAADFHREIELLEKSPHR
jgi:transcriptional repressor NrdR